MHVSSTGSKRIGEELNGLPNKQIKLSTLPVDIILLLSNFCTLQDKSVLICTCRSFAVIGQVEIENEKNSLCTLVAEINKVLGIGKITIPNFVTFGPSLLYIATQRNRNINILQTTLIPLSQAQLLELEKHSLPRQCDKYKTIFTQVLVINQINRIYSNLLASADQEKAIGEFLQIFDANLEVMTTRYWINTIRSFDFKIYSWDSEVLEHCLKLLAKYGKLQEGLELILSYKGYPEYTPIPYLKVLIIASLEMHTPENVSQMMQNIDWGMIENEKERGDFINQSFHSLVNSYCTEYTTAMRTCMIIEDSHYSGEWIKDPRIITAFKLIRQLTVPDTQLEFVLTIIYKLLENQIEIFSDESANVKIFDLISEYSSVKKDAILDEIIRKKITH